jgi:hypothetical protein
VVDLLVGIEPSIGHLMVFCTKREKNGFEKTKKIMCHTFQAIMLTAV